MDNRLIIQGNNITETQIGLLRELTGAHSIEAMLPTVCRFNHVQETRRDEIAAWCEQHSLDFGFVPAHRSPHQFKLLAMDMDSTLIAIECIDEIGDLLGIKSQIAAITTAAMRGEMPFAESLTRRVRLLAGLDESLLQHVYDQRVQLNPGAETLLAFARQHGIKTLLISGGFTFFTERLHAQLQLDYSAGNRLDISNGRLTGQVVGEILDAQGKADQLNRVARELGATRSEIIAIGDGANDLCMMAQAGVSIAYHAKPTVREQADYSLNFNGLDAVPALLGHDFAGDMDG